MSSVRTAPDHTLTGYPPGVPYIIGNEGCERFSFYGMRAILYVYMAGLFFSVLHMDPQVADKIADSKYHLFNAAVYAFPILGALLAERLLGRYRTIFWLSLVYSAGHLVLSLSEGSIAGMELGLFLIAVGAGGIKPCVSANVGDQFGKGNWHLLSRIYNAFYFIINLGSFFATLIIPAIRGTDLVFTYGAVLKEGKWVVLSLHSGTYSGSVSLAFGIPGILMGLATLFFWAGRAKYVRIPPSPGGKRGLLDVFAGLCLFMVFAWPLFFSEPVESSTAIDLIVCGASLAAFFALFYLRQHIAFDKGSFLVTLMLGFLPALIGKRREGKGFFGTARALQGPEAVVSAVAVLRVVGVFAFVSVFWALFDQQGSTWIAQADAMNRNIKGDFLSWLLIGAGCGVVFGAAIGFSMQGKRKRQIGFGIGFALSMVGAALYHTLAHGADGIAQLKFDPSQVQFLNPLMVMIFIPITTELIYPLMRRIGWEPTQLRRMTFGMVLASLSFVASALLQVVVDGSPGGLHVLWQMVPYALITMAECMVSITGLEFGYSQAPKNMKSIIMGFWLLTVAIGNLLDAKLFAGFQHWALGEFFWFFAGLMAVAAVLFGLIARVYKYRDVIQGDEATS